MNMKLNGKIAVVTGASSGIGAGIAKALGAEGATVIVNYSSSKAGADAVVASIKTAGGKAVAVQADMSKGADVIRLFDTVKADRGQVDVLVNNAGIAVFLASDDAHWVTGESIRAAGGVRGVGY